MRPLAESITITLKCDSCRLVESLTIPLDTQWPYLFDSPIFTRERFDDELEVHAPGWHYNYNHETGTHHTWCDNCFNAQGVVHCPQCGEATETLYEGYCEDCRSERQNILNEHNARFDFWKKCTEAEKTFYIRQKS